MTNPTPQVLINPVLEDAAFLLIRNKLESGLSWLNKAYGKAQKIVNRSGNIPESYFPSGREVYFPGIHVGGNEYLDMFPDEHLGNYSFFDMRLDEYRVDNWATKSPKKMMYKFNAGLIVWFDFRTVYPSPADWQKYSVSNVVKLVIDELAAMTLPGVHLEVDRYFETVENIYRGYTHTEIKNQFAMKPYGLFRIDLDINYRILC